jgi:hypothetical protein
MSDPIETAPFGLKTKTVPRVRAEAGHVIVRLEIVSLRDSADMRDFELVLVREYAAMLGFELVDAARKIG